MDEDKELVKKTLQGEKEAFETIIRKYQNPVLNYIGRMIRDREMALEFTQEVFIKSYSALDTYHPKYKFSSWLFKIASNLVIDYWRKKKISTLSINQKETWDRQMPSLQVPDKQPSIIKKFELKELRIKIEGALRKIPASFRELFIWRHFNDLSYEEIAEIKDLPVGTIKNRVFQAKEMIRRLLEENSEMP